MSKYLILFLITFSFAALAEESVESNSSKYASNQELLKSLESLGYKGSELYQQCDSFSKKWKKSKLAKIKTESKESSSKSSVSQKHLQKYSDCLTQVDDIKNMLELDSKMYVNPEKYIDDIKHMVKKDHIDFLIEHGSILRNKIISSLQTDRYSISFPDKMKAFDYFKTKKSSYSTDLSGFNSESESSVLDQELFSLTNLSNQINSFVSQYSINLSSEINNDLPDVSEQVTFMKPLWAYGETDGEFKHITLNDEARESVEFIDEGYDIVSSGNNSSKDTIMIVNDAYYERLAAIAISKICGAILKSECGEKITRLKDINSILNHEKIKASNNGKAELNILAFESFKMMGHWYALRKFEKFIVENQGLDAYGGKGDVYQSSLGSTCVRESRYTVDFKACRNMAGAQNLYSITSIADQSLGGLATGLQNQSAQKKYANAIASGEDATKAGLDVQTDTYKSSSTIAATAGAAYGGAAATMTAMLATYPSQAKFSRKCENGSNDDGLDYCYLLQHIDNQQMFFNAGVKAQSWGMVGSLAAEALKHGMEAMHFSEMAKQTQGIKDDYNGALEEVATIGFDNCSTNPDLCDNNSATETSTTLGLGNFSFGSNGYNTQAYSPTTESTGDIDTATGISKKEAASLSDSLNDGGESLSKDFKKIAAGKLGSKRSAGGGSGGGGASSGGAGGSGGGAPGSGGDSASGPSGVPNGKSSWQSGGSVSSIRGGTARKKSKASPYGDLFNKSKNNRNIASEANDIDDKSSKLFEKISKRYGDLSSKNRLKSF